MAARADWRWLHANEWLDGPLPVAQAGDDDNHLRSSFGRVAGEAAFWAPATLLPQQGVLWEETGEPNLARAVITHGTLEQTIEIAVAENGQPRWVQFQRWSDANPEKEWRLQPFGGYLDDFRNFAGFTLPTKVDGGNHFGTEVYFPFFRARVGEVRFPVR